MRLSTKRLVLRELGGADWEIVHYVRNDPRVLASVGATERPEPSVRDWVDACAQAPRGGARHDFSFAVERNAPGGIGSTFLGVGGVRVAEARGSLFVELDSSVWGQGLGAEVLDALAHLAFGELRLERLEIVPGSPETAARAWLARLGFVGDGVPALTAEAWRARRSG